MNSKRRVARTPLAIALISAAWMCTTPIQAAASFPGSAGPIAYSQWRIHQDAEFNRETVGGLSTHGPRKGGRERQITFDPSDDTPSYSPDGRWLVFASGRDQDPSTGRRIYLVRSDGGGLRALTSGESWDSSPSFSPSGRSVVFDSRPLTGGTRHIFVVGLGGSAPRQLTYGPASDREPVFTPDGRTIVFASNRVEEGEARERAIWATRPDGTHRRRLTSGHQFVEPDISPDGRQMVFATASNDIYVSGLNGRGVHRLSRLRCEGCYSAPVWAPDGKHIAALRSKPESSAIVVFRPDGSDAKTFVAGTFVEDLGGPKMGPPTWGPKATANRIR